MTQENSLIRKLVRFSKFLIGFMAALFLLAHIWLPTYSIRSEIDGKLKIVESEQGYSLSFENNAYRIKGAAGNDHLASIKALGGNSLRLYRYFVNDTILNEADSLGLHVMLDLNMPHPSERFDYTDEAKVDSLIEKIASTVEKYKSHKSISIWNLGNEPINSSHTLQQIRVWKVIARINERVQSISPHLPTSISVPQQPMALILSRFFCPDIDILSLNAFRYTLSESPFWPYCVYCWDGPYIYSEIGPIGHWQADYNAWGVPLDWTDERRSFQYDYMQSKLRREEANCLGAYVFFWGNKFERTHTWFNLFNEEGEKSPLVDQIAYSWTGKYPENRSPFIQDISMDDSPLSSNLVLSANKIYQLKAQCSDPENDSIYLSWKIFKEGEYRDRFFGAEEVKARELKELILDTQGSELRFKAPEEYGQYRLYAYARDKHGNCSNFNFPFFVVLEDF